MLRNNMIPAFGSEDAKRETKHDWIKKAYIEIQILKQGKEASYETFKLKPEIAVQFNVGDKWIIEQGRIASWVNVFEDCTHLQFSENKEAYFSPFSNRCFIQIVERLFNGDRIELHGKIVPPPTVSFMNEDKMILIISKIIASSGRMKIRLFGFPFKAVSAFDLKVNPYELKKHPRLMASRRN